jgi:hypothetical protein
LIFLFLLETAAENMFDFVKIILLKSDSCVFAFSKRLFRFVKPMLLPCKTYTFAMQNNESYNALVLGRLYKKYVMTKYLQPYGFLFAPEMNRSC